MFHLSKATFEKTSTPSVIRVKNHLKDAKPFNLNIEVIEGIGRAFKEISRGHWELVGRDNEDSPRGEYNGIDVAPYNEFETIRVVLHKYKSRPSISVGAYESLRTGGWHRTKFMFAIYSVDDMDKLISDLKNSGNNGNMNNNNYDNNADEAAPPYRANSVNENNGNSSSATFFVPSNRPTTYI